MTPGAGEIWTADNGEELRRDVVVLSSERFHQLAGRAVIAPILDKPPTMRAPWFIALPDGRHAAINLVGSIPTVRLLRRSGWIGGEALHHAERALRAITEP